MAWDNDLEDGPTPAWRDHAPDLLAPIDPDAPVSGHHAPEGTRPSPADAPEHDWSAASRILVPVLRPPGTLGRRLADLNAEQLASEGMKNHAAPLLDDGPGGLVVGYALRIGAFDVMVNADHLLAWRTTPAYMRGAAMANLAEWSATAPWTDEVSGHRRILSSASGDGGDAARVLLSEVRSHLEAELGSGARVLVGMPERDLLVAGALYAGDEEFAALFSEFVREQARGADQPLDERVYELVGGDVRQFEG